MLTCIECRCSILHRTSEGHKDVQYGLCIPCFTKRLEAARNRNLWALSDVDIELLQQDALIIDERLMVVGINGHACKRFGLKPVRCRGRQFHDVLPLLNQPQITEWCEANIEGPRVKRHAVEGMLEMEGGPQWCLIMMTAGRGRGSIVVDLNWHSRLDDVEADTLMPADVVLM